MKITIDINKEEIEALEDVLLFSQIHAEDPFIRQFNIIVFKLLNKLSGQFEKSNKS